MFSKTITNSSQFLMMPHSSQNLYFHLGMNADDDGYCEHFAIARMTDSKPDDLKILHAKGFVKVFDDKVLVILDWKENNYLRADRYTPSKYLKLYGQEMMSIPMDTIGIPPVDQCVTQDRIGKDREGKAKKDKGDVSLDPSFETFWTLYDKKRNRAKCITLWAKVSPDTYDIIFDHVKKYVASTPDVSYRKDPERYIKYKCWEDEIIRSAKEKADVAWCHDD